MISPPFLNTGSKIRIVSPAGKIKETFVFPAINWLEKHGYKVELGKHVFTQHFQFAGTDAQRLEDLQAALDDPECSAILCSRGGYGMVRIIDKLDFAKFKKHPKWIVGFSDITILHLHLNNLGVTGIHGAMPKNYLDKDGNPNENLISLINLLDGRKMEYSLPSSNINRKGVVSGQLVGGNLSIIASLQGTKYELDTNGKILFLEDIDEFLYHSDRMIHQLKLAGKFEKLAGLILGDFTEMKDNELPFGKTINEIIMDAVQEFDYPVYFGFSAGHDKKNLALAFGKNWELNVAEKQSTFKMC
jgi:muramoyltetrapeptide carboxypeptidase